jgi:ABC-type polysaccharide/polyol phosphate export permease
MVRRNTVTRNDRLIGIAVLILGTLMLYTAYTLDFPQFANDPGPVFMPKVIGFLLVFCAIGLLVWPKKLEVKKDAENEHKQKENNLKMAITAVSLVIYAILINILGFFISTVLFLSFLTWFLSEVKNKKVVILSITSGVIIATTIFIVFEKLLSIILPKGIF